ncbi:MAG: 6-phosphofructokinase [Syntrophomonadaceae bacterium]
MSGIAVLTSGGDAPGMNAAIRAVVRAGIYNRFDVFGVLQGFEGLISGNLRQMTPGSVADIIHRGGTILQTSRSKSFMTSEGREQARQVLQDKGIEHLVVIGGNGSLRGAYELSKLGCNAIGIPATIDNDIVYTQSIGFDTAVNTALEAINRIRDTATSHGRVFIIEVMGRRCGEIALSAGVAGGAESILIPEIENDLPAMVDKIKKGAKRGKLHSIIVVAEGACPVMELRDYIHEKTGHDIRVSILGHVQRGGTPTGVDRILASCMGKAAVDYISEGKRNGMVARQHGRVHTVPLQEVINGVRTLELGLFEIARVLST